MILLYTPTSAEGAEVKQFYEDLQELSFSCLCSQRAFPSCSFLFALARWASRCRPPGFVWLRVSTAAASVSSEHRL